MKQKYTDLAKKHNLPDVQQWVHLEDELTVYDVRKALAEKLYGFVDTLDLLLHPEGVSAMVEAQEFTEPEQDALREFYNHLMLLGKDCYLADIQATEQEDIELIRRLAKEWPNLVKEMSAVIKKTKEAYSSKTAGRFTASYLG